MSRIATNGHAYWRLLLQRHQPELAAHVRVIASTATAPIPAFVASPAVLPEISDRLSASFASAQYQTWFCRLAASIMIESFASSALEDFDIIRAREDEAVRAGYPLPR